MAVGFAGMICVGPALAASPAAAGFDEGDRAFRNGDFARALAEFLPAAASGDANAQEMIGVIHALGLGVPADRGAAFTWYLRAAERGHAGAQSGVGWYYEVGLGGVPVDLVRAHLWYALSAAGGDPDAALSLPEVEKKMTRKQIAEAQAAARARLAK